MKSNKVLKKMVLNKKTVANLDMRSIRGGKEAPNTVIVVAQPTRIEECWISECPTACTCPYSWHGDCPSVNQPYVCNVDGHDLIKD